MVLFWLVLGLLCSYSGSMLMFFSHGLSDLLMGMLSFTIAAFCALMLCLEVFMWEQDNG